MVRTSRGGNGGLSLLHGVGQLVVIVAVLAGFGVTQDCPAKDDAQVAATSRVCKSTACISDDDCRRSRTCECDDICGPVCLPTLTVPYCPEIPATEGVDLTYVPSNQSFHSEAFAECAAGYSHQSGDSVRTCRGDKLWSLSQYLCSKVICEPIPDVPNTEVHEDYVKAVYTAFDVINFKCDWGYYREESARLECYADGSWSVPAIQCYRKSCPYTQIQNGRIVGGSFLYGDTVEVVCNTGYTLHGQRLMQCLGDQNWSGFERTCEITTCPALNAISNGDKRGSTYTYNSDVSYTCNAGFVVDGSERRRCQADGTWSGDTASCKAVVCSEPGRLDHGSRQGNNFGYMDVVFFRCDESDGYTLSGSKSAVCQQNEEWSEPLPFCYESIPPVFHTVMVDITVRTADGLPTANVIWPDPEVSDNSGNYSLIYSHNPESDFNIGITIVTVTAVDPSNNRKQIQFSITVTDPESPRFIFVPPAVIVNTEPKQSQGIATWNTPDVSDNSGSYDLSSTFKSGALFPYGTTTVTFTAVDPSGNKATAELSITVNDVELPVFVDPTSQINAVINTEQPPGANVDWVKLVAKDNVQDPDLTCNHNPGDWFPLGVTQVDCVATDIAGNKAMHAFDVIVEEAPTTPNIPTTSSQPTTDVVTRPSHTDKTIINFKFDVLTINSLSVEIAVDIIREGNITQSSEVCVDITNNPSKEPPEFITDSNTWKLKCQGEKIKGCLILAPYKKSGTIVIYIELCITWVKEAISNFYGKDKFDFYKVKDFFHWLTISGFSTKDDARVEYGNNANILFEIAQCPVLDSPSNGIIQNANLSEGNKAKCLCDTLHAAKGSKERECLADATWNGQDCKCEQDKLKIFGICVLAMSCILAIVSIACIWHKCCSNGKYKVVCPDSNTANQETPESHTPLSKMSNGKCAEPETV